MWTSEGGSGLFHKFQKQTMVPCVDDVRADPQEISIGREEKI